MCERAYLIRMTRDAKIRNIRGKGRYKIEIDAQVDTAQEEFTKIFYFKNADLKIGN